VVRTADCPVLTVREPREKEAKKPAGAAVAAGALLVTALLLSPLGASTAAAQGAAADPPQTVKQNIAGGELFRTYCATCHGTAARGDGPLADSMKRRPADLTEIAKRNGGMFPADTVFRTIDGRRPVRGHGGPDMPVWGDAFERSRDGGDAEKVRTLIQSLVDYLEAIQAKLINH
jgi:mono/diheme cytochrome c family protein